PVSTTVCPVTETHVVPHETTTKLTTSTVYTTKVHTVTKCPPEVTNCPKKPHVTTETIPVSTTVCPVTETHVVPHETTTKLTTSTVYTTKVHTVTKCPPEVT
ncbi:hypothetical protein H9Q74_014567, partial [Fusarium xylarioides]